MKINKFIFVPILFFVGLSIIDNSFANNHLESAEAEEEYKIEITSSSSYSYCINEEINFSISSIYELDDSYTYYWTLINDGDEIVYSNNNKSFSYTFLVDGFYDVNLLINNNISLSKTINVYKEKNHEKQLSFNCDRQIGYLLDSSLNFEIEAYIDEVIDDDYIYSWVIEDHDIITFSSLTNYSSVILKPLKEGKTRLILNALNNENNDIKSNYIDIIVIKEIKTIDALPDSNYVKPGEDLLIEFAINTIPHIVNYNFNYEIYFNNELFLDYTKILNYSVLIKDIKEGKYTVKIESISSFKKVNITCDKYQFFAIFMMVLPYIISFALIAFVIFLYVKSKKKKSLTIKECVILLNNLKEKYYLLLEENKIDEKEIYLTYKKLFKFVKALKIESDRFVMYISADAFNIVTTCEDILSFLGNIKLNDFKKLTLDDKKVIIDMLFKKQITDLINCSNLFLKNYEEYQSYRDEEKQKEIKDDKFPSLKLEFKTRNDYLEYILNLAKQKKDKEDAIDK